MITSKQVVAAFKAQGIKVRVKDLGNRFRVVGLDTAAFREQNLTAAATANQIAIDLGCMTNRAVLGGYFMNSVEFLMVKPGMIRRV
jgi:hypothetical protein